MGRLRWEERREPIFADMHRTHVCGTRRLYGSVRGVPGDGHPYRDLFIFKGVSCFGRNAAARSLLRGFWFDDNLVMNEAGGMGETIPYHDLNRVDPRWKLFEGDD